MGGESWKDFFKEKVRETERETNSFLWRKKKRERAGEDRQAAKTKKREKPEGAKLLRNKLEEEKKIEKGGTNLRKETGEVYKKAETGGIFGSKVRKQNHPFWVPSSCSSLCFSFYNN